MGKRGILNVLICVFLLALGISAQAQEPKKTGRIGFLGATSSSTVTPRIEAFRQGLHELGYVDGENITIEYRYADGKPERLPGFAAELVHLKVDVIVTGGPTATRPAKNATDTVPIVMAADLDPVANGFVTSLARPGGNITGLSILAPEISGKQLELLKEIVPKLSRVAFLRNSNEPATPHIIKEIEAASEALQLRLQKLDIRNSKDIEMAFREARNGRADAVVVPVMPILNSERAQIAELALKNRLPTVYGQPEYVENGGLIYYGPSVTAMFRRAATYVDKILKGAKPSDLPVEQPTKFELVINLKTAKQIGLTVPQSVLYRADRVIK